MTVTSEAGTAVHGGEHVVHQDRNKKQHSGSHQGVRQRPSRVSRQPALPANLRGLTGIKVSTQI